MEMDAAPNGEPQVHSYCKGIFIFHSETDSFVVYQNEWTTAIIMYYPWSNTMTHSLDIVNFRYTIDHIFTFGFYNKNHFLTVLIFTFIT